MDTQKIEAAKRALNGLQGLIASGQSQIDTGKKQLAMGGLDATKLMGLAKSNEELEQKLKDAQRIASQFIEAAKTLLASGRELTGEAQKGLADVAKTGKIIVEGLGELLKGVGELGKGLGEAIGGLGEGVGKAIEGILGGLIKPFVKLFSGAVVTQPLVERPVAALSQATAADLLALDKLGIESVGQLATLGAERARSQGVPIARIALLQTLADRAIAGFPRELVEFLPWRTLTLVEVMQRTPFELHEIPLSVVETVQNDLLNSLTLIGDQGVAFG